MKQVFIQKGIPHTRDVPPPLLEEQMVLVAVAYSFISKGTEKATIHQSGKSIVNRIKELTSERVEKIITSLKTNGILGTARLINNALTKIIEVGYSCSGVVVAVGPGVEKIQVGDYVACAGAGFANHGQYVLIPHNLTAKITKPEQLKELSATTLGAIALQGVRRAQLNLGETVLVYGLGLLGLLTVQLSKLAGYRVIGIDILEENLEKARTYGIDLALNPAKEDFVTTILFATEHHGVDGTIITASTDSVQIIDNAIRCTRIKGKIILVGNVPITFDREEFYKKELDFLISCSYGPGRYDKKYEQEGLTYPYSYIRWTEGRNLQYIAHLIENEKLNIKDLISATVSIDNAQEAYKILENRAALGAVLSYQDIHYKEDHPVVQLKRPTSIKNNMIGLAIVGAGGFVKTKLLPLLKKRSDIIYKSVIDTNMAQALTIAEHYGFETCHNNYKALTHDHNANCIIIATPHHGHAEQTITLLSHSKAVFVEKPLAVTLEQLNTVKLFFKAHPTAPCLVDFNRSHAPLIKAIIPELHTRTSPLIISYRMNAGYLPSDHWIQSTKHGGRIIGEVCHVFELFETLIDQPCSQITVNVAGFARDDMKQADTTTITCTYYDGSIATVLYVSTGNTALSKERMELFWEGKSIILNDYISLESFGLKNNLTQTLLEQDKGHEAIMKFFLNGIKDDTLGTNPVYMQKALTATHLSIIAANLAAQGGGTHDYALDNDKEEKFDTLSKDLAHKSQVQL